MENQHQIFCCYCYYRIITLIVKNMDRHVKSSPLSFQFHTTIILYPLPSLPKISRYPPFTIDCESLIGAFLCVTTDNCNQPADNFNIALHTSICAYFPRH